MHRRLCDYPYLALAMPATESTWLTISWSKDTDLALRRFLGARGLKKGALSAFIEDAVRWRLFEQTVRNVRAEIASERKAAAKSA